MIQVLSAGSQPHQQEVHPSGAATDKDVAWAVVSDEAGEIDPAIEKRALRKIDAFFMPAMLIGSFCCAASESSVYLPIQRMDEPG